MPKKGKYYEYKKNRKRKVKFGKKYSGKHIMNSHQKGIYEKQLNQMVWSKKFMDKYITGILIESCLKYNRFRIMLIDYNEDKQYYEFQIKDNEYFVFCRLYENNRFKITRWYSKKSWWDFFVVMTNFEVYEYLYYLYNPVYGLENSFKRALYQMCSNYKNLKNVHSNFCYLKVFKLFKNFCNQNLYLYFKYPNWKNNMTKTKEPLAYLVWILQRYLPTEIVIFIATFLRFTDLYYLINIRDIC